MQRPDLIVFGFSESPLHADPFELLRMAKPFKRITQDIQVLHDGRRYPDTTVLTLTVDDPDFVSDDLHVLFLVTPSEQQYPVVMEAVRDLCKVIVEWFGGFLLEVNHFPDKTLCVFCHRTRSQDDDVDEIPVKIPGSLWGALDQRATAPRGSEEAVPVSDLPGSGTDAPDSDHSRADPD